MTTRAVMKEEKVVKRDQLSNDACFVIDGGAIHRVRLITDALFGEIQAIQDCLDGISR